MINLQDRDSTRKFGNQIGWAAFLTFDLIILGALVRATDSGLACPDWPLCYNQLTPVMDMQIFLEWFHRLSALILGGFLIRAAITLLRRPGLRQTFGMQLYCVGFLFLSQCALGGLTVLKLLDPKIVSLHLINAVVFFAVLFWIAIKAKLLTLTRPLELKAPPASKIAFLTFTVLVFGQIILGGLVSTNHAGLVCPDFPKCHDQWLPAGSYLIYLQQSHRLVAFIMLAYSIVMNIVFFRPSANLFFNSTVRLIPTLVLLQGLLGIINVSLGTPVWASVAHLANALLLFTVSFAATVFIYASNSHKKMGLADQVPDDLNGGVSASEVPSEVPSEAHKFSK